MVQYDLDDTEWPVCPWCGHGNQNTWCGQDTAHNAECEECDRLFVVEPEHTVTFSTRCQNSDHKWGPYKKYDSGTARFCLRCGAWDLKDETQKETK